MMYFKAFALALRRTTPWALFSFTSFETGVISANMCLRLVRWVCELIVLEVVQDVYAPIIEQVKVSGQSGRRFLLHNYIDETAASNDCPAVPEPRRSWFLVPVRGAYIELSIQPFDRLLRPRQGCRDLRLSSKLLVAGPGHHLLSRLMIAAGYAVECNEFSKIFATFANYLFNDCGLPRLIPFFCCVILAVHSRHGKLHLSLVARLLRELEACKSILASYNSDTISKSSKEGGLWINHGPLNYKKDLRLKLTVTVVPDFLVLTYLPVGGNGTSLGQSRVSLPRCPQGLLARTSMRLVRTLRLFTLADSRSLPSRPWHQDVYRAGEFAGASSLYHIELVQLLQYDPVLSVAVKECQ
eukprot:584549-Hanusia_phi.AAC.2